MTQGDFWRVPPDEPYRMDKSTAQNMLAGFAVVMGLISRYECEHKKSNSHFHLRIRDIPSKFGVVGTTKCQLAILVEPFIRRLKRHRKNVGFDDPTREQVIRDCGDACEYGWE
jgi:hypothetical protein